MTDSVIVLFSAVCYEHDHPRSYKVSVKFASNEDYEACHDDSNYNSLRENEMDNFAMNKGWITRDGFVELIETYKQLPKGSTIDIDVSSKTYSYQDSCDDDNCDGEIKSERFAK